MVEDINIKISKSNNRNYLKSFIKNRSNLIELKFNISQKRKLILQAKIFTQLSERSELD